MWTTRETLCLIQAVIVLGVLFLQLLKYKSDKITWKVFSFVFINIALQVSAFLILPLDIVNVDSSKERRQTKTTKRENYL